MKKNLLLVYHGESGLFNTVAHMAHKIFSPATYPCRLCAITNSNLGLRKEWKQFLETLEMPFEFLHADELKSRHGLRDLSLPAILLEEDEALRVLIDSDSINACNSSDDLMSLIRGRITVSEAVIEEPV